MASESARAAAPAEFPPIPDYEPIRRIGRGSYGDVWLVRGVTGAWRAIKIVWRARFAEDAPFEREFRGLSAVMSASLGGGQLALLHAGRGESDRYFYYVMELADDVTGGRIVDPATYEPLTLKALIAREGRRPVGEVVAHGIQLARALAALHARGLLHRDIKPSNIILLEGAAKLSDIGLVASMANAGTFVGTEGFVPPEGPGSAGADVYALGKVLYELATGRDRAEFPQLPDDLGAADERAAYFALNAILLRACDAVPARRYRDGAALLEALLAVQAGCAPRRVDTLGWKIGLAAVAALAAGVTVAVLVQQPMNDRPVAAAPVAAKSLVVLPLENLSSNPANAYFTDGTHQEIIATLQRLTDLRVISRDSALLLKHGSASLAEIARRAGVDHVVTGSVQREGERVRIQLELRRASDEQLLWTLPNREHELTKVFAVQSEIAEAVARVLQVREDRTGERGARFTNISRAYDLYLQSGVAMDRRFAGGSYAAAVDESIRLLDESLALDPGYFAATEALGITHIFAYRSASDPAKRFRHAQEAKRWIERATELMPGGAVDSAWANYYTRVEIDCVRAEQLARHAVHVWPNDAYAQNRLGLALRGQGRTDEAVAAFRRAIALDPLARIFWQNLIHALAELRRTTEFEAAVAHVTAVSADDLAQFSLPLHRAQLYGESDETEAGEAAGMAGLMRRRQFAEALALNGRALDSARLSDLNRLTALNRRSDFLRRLDRADEAREAGREAVALAEKLQTVPAVDRSEKDGRFAGALVRAGRVDEGLAVARRFVEAMRVPAQQEVRWRREIQLAQLLARAGRMPESVALLKKLLAAPTGLTVPLLRNSPEWDDLRGDAGFEALLADPRNHAPL